MHGADAPSKTSPTWTRPAIPASPRASSGLVPSNSMPSVPSGNAARTLLPVELWDAIVMHFRLGPMKLGNYLPDSEFLERRGCLYRLCLTSRALLAVARPFLYESVVLYVETAPRAQGVAPGAESLVQLLRTLTAQPALRPHVKHLACTMPIGPKGHQFNRHDRNATLEAIVYSWLATCHDFQGLSADDERLLRAVGLWPVPEPLLQLVGRALPLSGPRAGWWLEHETTAQQLFTALLCLTPNVATLLLEGSRCRQMEQCLARLRRDLGLDVLAHLETLRVQAGEGRKYFLSFHAMDDVIHGFLEVLPSVRRVDLWRAWMPSRRPDDRPHYDWLKQLNELHLGMYPEPKPVCEMIQHVSRLKSLALDFLEHISPVPSAWPTPSNEMMNEVLLLHKATLTQLRITGHLAYRSTSGSSIRLWCLKELTWLKYLVIDLSTLCDLAPLGNGNHGTTRCSLDMAYTQLFDSLSQGLESLLLVFDGEWTMYLHDFLVKAADVLRKPWEYPNLAGLRHLHLSIQSPQGARVSCFDGQAASRCEYPSMLDGFRNVMADSVVMTWDLEDQNEFNNSAASLPKLTPWSLGEFEPPATFTKAKAAGAASQLQERTSIGSLVFTE